MSFIKVILHHALEIFFALSFASGAKWAKVFVRDVDWSEKVEMLIDFILIAQSWIICPLIFLNCCVITFPNTATLIVGGVLFFQVFALAKLILWKRSEFFRQPKGVRVGFRFFPVFLLVLKLFIEFTSGGTTEIKPRGIAIATP